MRADAEQVTAYYTRCEVIFEERLPPGVARRAVAYYSSGDVVLFLYTDTIVLNGRAEIAYLAYDGAMGPIMDLIR